jgi:hypothetical protein
MEQQYQHHVYTISCIPIARIYVGHNIDPLCRFQKHCINLPSPMFFDVRNFQPFENNFKLDVIFSSFHKYQVDRVEHKHITTLEAIEPNDYSNLRSTLSSNCKYWQFCCRNILLTFFYQCLYTLSNLLSIVPHSISLIL